jgi:hypothetical protein
MKRILHKLVIGDISTVDRPANQHARALIMKRDDSEDHMEKFTKAEANAEWDRALQAYADRNKLSKSAAAAEFSTTIEAKTIYNKVLRAQPGPPIAKAARSLSKAEQTAVVLNGTLEQFAKDAFPDDRTPTAIAKYLATPAGQEFYSDYLEEKANVGVR